MITHEALLDELLKDCKTPEDLLGQHGLLKQLTKDLLERMLQEELTEHLGYDKHDPHGRGSGNSRNGSSSKTIRCDQGKIQLDVPRDRRGEFEPKVVPKGQRSLPGLDEKIISMYARGMSTRQIQEHLEELYGIDTSPELISRVTDGVADQVAAWQNRPLEAVYPIVYLDALRVKIRDHGSIRNKAVHLALGITTEGTKELLGLWLCQTEGAKFWLQVLTELKNRGVQDILIASVDGLTGFPEAIATVFPETQIQRCIVHQIRNSLKFVSYKDRRQVARDLKPIYQAATASEAGLALEAFAQTWDDRYPMISRSWTEHWDELTAFMEYPPEIRKVIYTTNAIESVNASLRKVVQTRRVFPTDEAAVKLMYLAIQHIAKRWTRPIRDWQKALNQFVIRFPGRIPIP